MMRKPPRRRYFRSAATSFSFSVRYPASTRNATGYLNNSGSSIESTFVAFRCGCITLISETIFIRFASATPRSVYP